MPSDDQATPLRVLLVEDNAADARLVREYLETDSPGGFIVDWVDRLSSALERLRQPSYDAILLDLSLPDSPPPRTLEALRTVADIPVVVLTGGDDGLAGMNALGSGAQDFLCKSHAAAADVARTVRYAIARKDLEVALKQRSAELEAAVRLKDLYADIIRHDLLDVLSIAKGAIDLVIEEPEDTENRDRMLEIAQRNLEKLQEILSAASLYSKVEKPDTLPPQPLDVTAVLHAAAERVRPGLERKGMTLEIAAPPTAPLQASRWIEDVFANLLSNAAKYSPEGSAIAAGVVDEGDHYRIYVRDTGEGIADADKPRLFTRFQRFHKEGVKGTGLGLAIVQRIVDLHGGRVWVEDNPAGGSVFWVELPKR